MMRDILGVLHRTYPNFTLWNIRQIIGLELIESVLGDEVLGHMGAQRIQIENAREKVFQSGWPFAPWLITCVECSYKTLKGSQVQHVEHWILLVLEIRERWFAYGFWSSRSLQQSLPCFPCSSRTTGNCTLLIRLSLVVFWLPITPIHSFTSSKFCS